MSPPGDDNSAVYYSCS